MSATTHSPVSVGVAGTTIAHGALLALALFVANRAQPESNQVYAVELIAAPLPAEAPRRAAQVAIPTKTEETVAIKPQPKPKTPPKKVPPKPVEQAKPVTTPPQVNKTTATPAPGETPSTGQDAMNLVKPGLDFPFPGYINNIYNAIAMRWSRPIGSTALRTEIGFTILKDGSAKEISIMKHSGNANFDRTAMSAVEAAGNAKAFGPLPPGFPGTELPISMSFSPIGRGPQ